MILKLIQRLVVGERISRMTWQEATTLAEAGQLTIAETERLIKIQRAAKAVGA